MRKLLLKKLLLSLMCLPLLAQAQNLPETVKLALAYHPQIQAA